MSDQGDAKHYDVVICCICAIDFGMLKAHHSLRKNDYRDFHCPNGHSQHYNKPVEDPKDAELKKLRAELETEKALTEKLQAELDALRIEVELWRPRKEAV